MREGQEPGRELDALIAVKVMGWTGLRVMPAGQLRGLDPNMEHLQTEYDRRHNRPPRLLKVPDFSTELVVAMSILPRITTLFGWASLSLTDSGRLDDGRRWIADINVFGPVEAETAPLAICLAALRAVDA